MTKQSAMSLATTAASTLLLLLLLIRGNEGAAASTSSPLMPEISIGMSTSNIDPDSTLKGIEPILKWSSKRQCGEYDLEGGLTLKVQDVDAYPYSLWGKVKRKVAGWNLSAKLDSKSSDLNTWGVDLQASESSLGTSVQVTGKANVDFGSNNPSVKVSSIKLSQKIDAPGGQFTVVPRYNLASKQPDVSVAYGMADTVLSVDASFDTQKLTVSQRIGDNSITPSITSTGDVEFEYRRTLPNAGSLSATYKPDDSVVVSWSDGPWEASFKAPMEGLYKFTEGVKVDFRRTVEFN